MRKVPVRTPHAVLLFLPVAVVGCGGDGGPATAGLDSPDIPLAPNVEDVYTVGVLDGADWEMFGRVRSVAFGEDGSLYILDSDAGHVVVVDPAGQFARTLSSEGEGPGELNGARSLAVLADGELAVHDRRGIQVFGRDGQLLQEAGFTFQTGMPGAAIHAMSDRTIIATQFRAPSFAALMGEEEEEEPEGRPIGRYRLDGTQEEFHMAWALPPAEVSETQTGNVRMIMSAMEAFPLPLSFDVLRDGRVALADSVGYRIKILDASGQVTGTLERPIAPIAVTDQIRDEERGHRLAALEEGGSGGGGGGGNVTLMVTRAMSTAGARGGSFTGPDQEQLNRMAADRVENMIFPEEVPVISRLAVDRSDRIWVQRSALMGEPGPTDILTVDGQYFGTIAPDGLQIPAAFGPDGLLAYIDRDELDIQRVRVVRLVGDQLLESAESN